MYIGIPIDKHHITISFNGKEETRQDYQRAVLALSSAAVAWQGPKLDIAFAGVDKFDGGVWHTKIISVQLEKFRKVLTPWLDWYSVFYADDFDYTPHITLSQYKRKPRDPYDALPMMFVNSVSVISNEFGETKVRI